MIVELPSDLRDYIARQVSVGRFPSDSDAIAEAVRQWKELETDTLPHHDPEFRQHLIDLSGRIASGKERTFPMEEVFDEFEGDLEARIRERDQGS